MAKDRHVHNSMRQDIPYLQNDIRKRIPHLLQQSLQVMEQGVQQGWGYTGPTVYVGLAGIALVYFRLHEAVLASSNDESSAEARRQSRAYLDRALDLINFVRPSPRLSFLDGQPGILAVKAAILQARGDTTEALLEAEKMQNLAPDVLQLPPGECELLYGRSGYLYALLFVRKYLGASAVRKDVVQAVVQQIVDKGRQTAARHPALLPFGLMYSWHDSHYLGGAHGISGILHTLLLACDFYSPQELYPDADLMALIRQGTEALADITFPSGNLPSSLGNNSDRLVQWCHGAPGFLPLAAKMAALESGPAAGKLRSAAQKAADVIWGRGLLLKGLGLCHGISGNAYTLLSAYRCMGEEENLQRAAQFGAFMGDRWQELLKGPDRPLSLFEGLGGAICFWADLMRPAKFPGYEL